MMSSVVESTRPCQLCRSVIAIPKTTSFVEMSDILLVEDKESFATRHPIDAGKRRYTVTESADARAAINEISTTRYRLVLTDLRMPNGSGLDVLRAARASDPDVPVILMTAFGSIDEAVQAMKDGAHDFLQKPVDSNHLLLLVERALEQARLRNENILLREDWSRRYGFPRIIGESDVMKRAVGETQRVAQTEATVLLLGESGTGKELFARAVHHLSNRRDKPLWQSTVLPFRKRSLRTNSLVTSEVHLPAQVIEDRVNLN
jgi:DNA-binding NtrC family response regulator